MHRQQAHSYLGLLNWDMSAVFSIQLLHEASGWILILIFKIWIFVHSFTNFALGHSLYDQLEENQKYVKKSMYTHVRPTSAKESNFWEWKHEYQYESSLLLFWSYCSQSCFKPVDTRLLSISPPCSVYILPFLQRTSLPFLTFLHCIMHSQTETKYKPWFPYPF